MPVPYMQRLTWKGVALPAGHLPGYPASHGCIRLLDGLSQLALRSHPDSARPVMILNPAQAQRSGSEGWPNIERANEEFVLEMAEQRVAADRALAETDRSKAAHQKALQRHQAEMAKYKSEVSPQ